MGTGGVGEKYRRAVETIAANCGGPARAILSAGDARFPPAGVRELAGRSPEYQRHVLGRAEAGDPAPLKRVAATLVVYETVAFREVVSRLARAAGAVRAEARLVERAVATGRPPDRPADRLLTLDLVAGAARRLLALLAGVPTAPGRGAAPPGTSGAAGGGEPADRLHAAAALGLIAKNVHDVPELRPAHWPTADERGRAAGLTRDILRTAATARDAGRRAFGRADDACRVRPRRCPGRRVITHAAPDGDAVVAAWLAERFLFAGEPVEVLFVPRGRALGAYRAGDCLVDVGSTHDPVALFFDHRPPAFPTRHASCAARLVWDRLAALGHPVGHLRELVEAVFAGDSAEARVKFGGAYDRSRRGGFHRALAGARAAGATDAGVYRAARRWLDGYDRRHRPPRP